jgi:lipid II:glycine glycyltransferase (peptidoglycan interpeptide bridge formation enzyme)
LRDGVEAAWKRLEGRARTSIRRAQEAGITIRRSTSPQDWRLFFDLHKITYERLHVPSYPEALFRVIFEQLVPAGLCVVDFAELNGAPIAATNICCYKQGGYFWHGFASDAGLRANALTLLVWNAMKTLTQSGQLHWFDCGDAVLHGSGKFRQLSDFKRSFGGGLYPAFRGQIDGSNNLYNRLVHLKAFVTGQRPDSGAASSTGLPRS